MRTLNMILGVFCCFRLLLRKHYFMHCLSAIYEYKTLNASFGSNHKVSHKISLIWGKIWGKILVVLKKGCNFVLTKYQLWHTNYQFHRKLTRLGVLKSSCASGLARLTNKPQLTYLSTLNTFAGRLTSVANGAHRNGLCCLALATKHPKSCTQLKSKSVWND